MSKQQPGTDSVFRACHSCSDGQLHRIRLQCEQLSSSCSDYVNSVKVFAPHSPTVSSLFTYLFTPHFLFLCRYLDILVSSQCLIQQWHPFPEHFSLDCSFLITHRSKKRIHTSESLLTNCSAECGSHFLSCKKGLRNGCIFNPPLPPSLPPRPNPMSIAQICVTPSPWPYIAERQGRSLQPEAEIVAACTKNTAAPLGREQLQTLKQVRSLAWARFLFSCSLFNQHASC